MVDCLIESVRFEYGSLLGKSLGYSVTHTARPAASVGVAKRTGLERWPSGLRYPIDNRAIIPTDGSWVRIPFAPFFFLTFFVYNR